MSESRTQCYTATCALRGEGFACCRYIALWVFIVIQLCLHLESNVVKQLMWWQLWDFFFKISISLFVLKLVSQPKLTFYVKWAFHCAYGWSVHWHTADVMPSSEMNAATCAFKTVFFINNIHIEMFVFVMVINHSGRYLKERLSFQRMLIGTCSASFCCVGCKALT